ncbi:cubilin-like [Macrobrachium rosenbergii]|uniref:cubilin-like n=1 Tax=Macrobrachium rosenbergii TaxID=79674 RepID=UPI0034D653BB
MTVPVVDRQAAQNFPMLVEYCILGLLVVAVIVKALDFFVNVLKYVIFGGLSSSGVLKKKSLLMFLSLASDRNETTFPPETTKKWYEKPQQRQSMDCSVNAGRVVASSGEIGIGSIGGSYNDYEYCVWEIEVPEGLVIQITWEYFDLEGPSPLCPYDYVDISEYATGESLTGKICGSGIPPPVRSRSNVVVVTFSSDVSVVFQGFRLHFEAIALSSSSSSSSLSSSSSSSSWSESYNDQYETTVPTETSPATQLPPMNCSVDTGRIVASSGEIGIGSIGGSYNNNEYCVWEIQVPEGLIIQFTWGYFNLEGPSPGCPYDYVDISEYGTGESLTGVICGSSIPQSVRSHSNMVRVTFRSDYSVTLQGFSLQFEAISDQYETTAPTAPEVYETTQLPQMFCSVNAGRIVAPSGEIGIGSIGGSYNDYEDCVWEIQVPEGLVIQFTWEYFDVEGPSPWCPYDYVDIAEYGTGKSLTGRICGSSIPQSVRSRSNFVRVTFNSDYSVTLQGFRLHYEAVSEMPTTEWIETTQLPPMNCSVDTGRIVAYSGEIGIGSIGGSYNINEYCVWEIEVPEGLVIQFTWEYFDLEGPSPWCPYDYVDISEYETGESLTGRICGSSIPQPVRSRSNTVRVTFNSDFIVTLQGFMLQFEAIAGDCDTIVPTTPTTWYETSQLPEMNCSVDTGRIVAYSGEIGIGSVGGSYNNNEYCVWEIEVPEGLIIKFTWEYFALEGPSPGCPFDYVDISEYESGDSLTGRICGSSIPWSVRSQSNKVRVTFSSDYSVTLQGFALQFEATSDQYETTIATETATPDWYETTRLPQTNCSVDTGRVVASSGEIGIGSIGGSYNDNEYCIWEIQVPEGQIIKFTWGYFSLEGPSSYCPYDYVDISEYETGESLTGRICGSESPPSVTSQSNTVVVTFISDASVTFQGFRLNFQAIPETSTTEWYDTTRLPQMTCSVEAGRVVASSGEIGIGSIVGSYNNNEYCVWEIEVPEGLTVKFTWDYVSLEGPSPGCPYDYVDISEYETGESLTGRICGSRIPGAVRSRSNKVRVTFSSDSSVTLQGFALQFEATSDQYETTIPTDTTTTEWYEITLLPHTNCSVDTGRVVASSGEIVIGSIGGSYSNNEYCVWEIEVPEGLIIKFTWDYFGLEGPSPGCPYDYVDISEYETGDSLTGRICGSSIPGTVRSRSNKVRVTFSSDSSVTLQGFALQFEATSDQYETTIPTDTTTTEWYEITPIPHTNCSVDTGRIVAFSGEIGIGSIGGSYNNNEYCVWEIQVPEGLVIKFTWEYFDLEGPSYNCPYDYVDISEYETGESLTGRICGSSIPRSVRSRSNMVRVTFSSDYSVTLQGFRLQFEALAETSVPIETSTSDWYETQFPRMNCGVDTGRLETTSGEIGIGSQNGSYANNEHCVWEIQVPDGMKVEFQWEYFNLEGPSPGCPYDYVDISEQATGESLTGRICGSESPPSVTSQSNTVVVTFISDASVTFQGFRLNFQAIPGGVFIS